MSRTAKAQQDKVLAFLHSSELAGRTWGFAAVVFVVFLAKLMYLASDLATWLQTSDQFAIKTADDPVC